MVALPTSVEFDQGDWNEILNWATARNVDTRELENISITGENIAEVIAVAVTGDDEPSFYGLVELTDGRFAGFEGWHDYTGWDCQSGVDWYVGESANAVLNLGLSQEARNKLHEP